MTKSCQARQRRILTKVLVSAARIWSGVSSSSNQAPVPLTRHAQLPCHSTLSTLAMMVMMVMMVVVMMLSTLTTLSSSKGGAARACQDCSVPAAAMWPNLQKMVFVCAKKEHFTSSVNVNFLSTYIFMYSFKASPLFRSN